MSDGLIPDSLREVEAVIGRRMDMLERENSRLQTRQRMMMWALGGLLLVTIVLTVLTAPRTALVSETLQANQFVLRDGSGLIRGIWEMEAEGGSRLVMRDGDGRERIGLSLLRDGSPGVTLGDRDGRHRIVLGLLPDGSTNLVFADGSGTARSVLGHSSTDETSLLFADREGYIRAGLVIDSDGEGGLTLYPRGQGGAAPSPEPNADIP